MIAEALDVLLRTTLASSAAIVLVLIARRPLRNRFGAQAAYLLWLLVPAAMVAALLPAPTMVAPLRSLSAPTIPAAVMSMASDDTGARFIDAHALMLLAWIAGAALCFAILLIQQRRFVRHLGRLARAGDRVWRASVSEACPALVGAWRPRIVIPRDFDTRYNAAERELILVHERTHSARGDAQTNLIAAALRCTFWFNPLFHIAASRLRFDQELACDAAVITRFPEARRPYADAMLKTQLADIGLPVGCYWQSSHPLKERISMLKKNLPSPSKRRLGVAVSTALIAVFAAVGWASQPKNVVETSPEASSIGAATPAARPDHHASYRSITRIVYPAAQAKSGTGATILVVAHIGVDGHVVSTSLRSGAGSTPDVYPLAQAALAGVQNWTFEPALKDGVPVPSDEIVPIQFGPDDQQGNAPSFDGALQTIKVASTAPLTRRVKDSAPSEDVSYRRFHPPTYPPEAVAAKASGKVVLKVLIGEKGEPESAEVSDSQPPEAAQIFGAASIAAVMQWRFNPGIRDGKPVAGYVLIPFDFDIKDDDT